MSKLFFPVMIIMCLSCRHEFKQFDTTVSEDTLHKYKMEDSVRCCGNSKEFFMSVRTLLLLNGKPDSIVLEYQPWGKQEWWLYKKNKMNEKKIRYIIEDSCVVGIL